MWYDGDSDSASLNPALNAAMLMMRYAPIASSTTKRDSYLVRPFLGSVEFCILKDDHYIGIRQKSIGLCAGRQPDVRWVAVFLVS